MKYACSLLAALGFLLAGCSRQDIASASATASDAGIHSVPVVTATRSNVTGSLTLTAEFIPYQEVDLMAKVAGYLKEISVDVGDRVHKGEVIATLEIPEMRDDLARAAAAIDQANAEMTRAEDEVRRAEAAHQIAHL